MAESPNVVIQPIAVSIRNAVAMSGMSRPTLYRRAAEGKLPLRKVNGKTLILVRDLEALIMGEAA
jgi:predicted DNA-binding transcriptional regulator AlpA